MLTSKYSGSLNALKWLSLLCFWLTLSATASAASKTPSLEEAYKKEYAFLEAQKRSLKLRLKSLERRSTLRIQRANRQLQRKQRRLLFLRKRNEQIQQDIQKAERSNASVLQYREDLSKLMERIRFSLKQKKVELPALSSDPKKRGAATPSTLLSKAFQSSASLLKKQAEVRKTKGRFFLPDGTLTQGTLVQVGQIASYGISSAGKGALAPAGGGRLKLWPKSAYASAVSLSQGQATSTLQIFLYENLNKEVTFKAKKSWYAFVNSGGVIGWIIVGLGALALLMILLRAVILLLASSSSRRLMRRLEPMVQSGQQDNALALCQSSRGAMSRVLQQAVQHMDRPRHQQEEVVAEAVLQEAPALERFGALIGVCAAVAPLLGLLGTVTGMISTFDVITEFGTGDPKLLAGGISEALVTTQLGLMVAIPTLLLGSLLSGRAEAILSHIEWGALRLMNLASLQKPPATSTLSTTPEPVESVEPSTQQMMGVM